MKLLIVAALLAGWGYLLRLLARAELTAWRFLTGCGGLFLLLMLFLRPLLSEVCVRCVCLWAGIIGGLTHTFSAYVPYGILCVQAGTGAFTLMVDLECSGMIEVAGYLSLLAFYRTYDLWERWLLGILGAVYLLGADVIRLTVIAWMVHFLGAGAYYAAHLFVGRILFYLFSTVLYYRVFTMGQVARIKLGSFSYRPAAGTLPQGRSPSDGPAPKSRRP